MNFYRRSVKHYSVINYNTYIYVNKIRSNNLNAIFHDYYEVIFYKNGKIHNSKNAAIYSKSRGKNFWLYDMNYSNEFTKKSWRKFVKMQAFL
jgi:hypothetical protein